MKRWRTTEQNPFQHGCVLSIGNFDGVHIGHQKILKTLLSDADALGLPAVVMTFDPHPTSLLAPERLPPRLTTADERAQKLFEAGVAGVFEYPTDWPLLRLSAEEFFQKYVVESLKAKAVVEGPNFYFGAKRAGNVDVLRTFCEQANIRLHVLPLETTDSEQVSSSLIRQHLNAGDVGKANRMLGRLYAMTGIVEGGAQRGRTIGFPTANVGNIETLVPANAVYAARAITPLGTFPAALNIGPNPTFGEDSRKVEAHLLNFAADIYGTEIRLEFVEKIRELQRFGSVEELQSQIHQDVARVSSLLAAG